MILLNKTLSPRYMIYSRLFQTKFHEYPVFPVLFRYLTTFICTIMAAPEFPQPMYEALRDISEELLVPGISKVPQNSLGLLKENRRFIEAYMCGLNHEFAAELLWREYPTDQRGSYFRQFWDVSGYASASDTAALSEEELKDMKPLHLWRDAKLGDNGVEIPPEKLVDDPGEDVVLVIRGDLFKRYPNTVLYAVQGVYDQEAGVYVPGLPEYAGSLASTVVPIFPLFGGKFPPDILFFKFPFSTKMALGKHIDNPGGIYFVLEERISEIRFGLDSPNSVTSLESWDDISWNHFEKTSGSGDVLKLQEDMYVDSFQSLTNNLPDQTGGAGTHDWNQSSATLAMITAQKPVRIVIPASRLLP